MNPSFIGEPTIAQQERASYLARALYEMDAEPDFENFWRAVPLQAASSHLDAIKAGRGVEEARIVFSSGGSTGSPKYTLVAFAEMLDNCVAHGDGYQACGVRSEDIVATWGMPSPMNSDFTIYLALAQCKCAILPLGEGTNPNRLLTHLNTFRPTVLLIMPSNFAPLADLLEASGHRLDHVRLMVTGGEPLRKPDQERFAKLLGENVFFRSVFQSSDTGTIGYQCQRCNSAEFHLHSELQLAEIIDADSDGIGELVLTNLRRTMMPVVRRRTGDVVSVLRRACACGSKTPRIKFVKRIGDLLKVGGEKLDIVALLTLQELLGVPSDDFRLEVISTDSGRDALRIASDCLALDDGLQDQVRDLLFRINEKLRMLVDCSIIAPVQFVPLLGQTMTTAAGKLINFVDLRNQASSA